MIFFKFKVRSYYILRFLISLSHCFLPLSIGLFLYPFFAHGNPIILSWDHNTEQDLAGYRIYYGTSSKRYTFSIDIGNHTTYTLPNLEGEKTYYIAATAYDHEGHESDFSEELVHIIPSGCHYVISPISQSFNASGGTGIVTVTTQSNCCWTASSNEPWLVATSNSVWPGSGTLNYSVLENSSGHSRTGTLIIAGQTVSVTQAGFPTNIIKAQAGPNGSISPHGTVGVPYGENQTFTIEPKKGFRVSDVKVDGVSQGPILSYTFKNVRTNHWIVAIFTRRTMERGNSTLAPDRTIQSNSTTLR